MMCHVPTAEPGIFGNINTRDVLLTCLIHPKVKMHNKIRENSLQHLEMIEE